MTEQRWEYRAQWRARYNDGLTGFQEDTWTNWATIETRGNRHGRNAYKTLGSARGIISREKRVTARRTETLRLKGVYEYEYRVQRRPVSDGWETV